MANHKLPAGAWFYADDIIALQEPDPNEAYIVIARVCSRLGLDSAVQERYITAHALLAAATRRLTVELDDNHSGPALCLRVELLPLWLATVDAGQVDPAMRPQLVLYQRECASLLWQSFRPQGFGTADELLPQRHEQAPAEQAYVGALAQATLARHQFLLERQLDLARSDFGNQMAPEPSAAPVDDPQAAHLARTVRRVAQTLAARTRRNEYGGVYSGLYRQFGISSYRRMPPGRLHEALEWLERWHGDMLGEPEPPPDI